jgi:glutamate---cysteine ligase / carboxylate-amine ligase
LLDFVDDVVDQVGARPAIAHISKMLERGTGADRQLAVFKETNNLVNVVDKIHNSFLEM